MSQFCTSVTCMDGRIQLPVIHFLQNHFDVDYVDIVSEAGMNRIMAENKDRQAVESVERRIRISVEKHQSAGIAIVGHHDCAGNPAPEDEQKVHIVDSVTRLKQNFSVPVVGLWVDENWQVSEVPG